MFRNVRQWAALGLTTVQFDMFIYGDSMEFNGPPTITYDNGVVVRGTVDKYADGEHATVVLDMRNGGEHAEIFVSYRAVRGTKNTTTYLFVERNFNGSIPPFTFQQYLIFGSLTQQHTRHHVYLLERAQSLI